jgi:hypothetical protein
MVSSFHLTRSARLLLAHQMNADKKGKTLLTKASGHFQETIDTRKIKADRKPIGGGPQRQCLLSYLRLSAFICG